MSKFNINKERDSQFKNKSNIYFNQTNTDMFEDLSTKELSRYSRHLTLSEIGNEGQKKLKNSKVLIVGTGGLGSPISLYLAATGVGTLGLIDFDKVEESNLQRQVLFGIDQVGKSKVKSAKDRLQKLNQLINIKLYETVLSSENAIEIIKNYDIVIDGTDNFPTRYLINDACVINDIPYVYGSIYKFEGQVSIFNFEGSPCYRCLFPSPPPLNLIPSCDEGGVLGILPGIIGCFQANEAIKLILKIGNSLKNRLLLFDALKFEFNEFKIQKDKNCAVCGKNPTITSLIDYNQFCKLKNNKKVNTKFEEISVYDLKKMIDSNLNPYILDIRDDFEVKIAKISGAIHIPMNEIDNRLSELNPTDELIVHCKSGDRSIKICNFLIKNNFKKVKNLKGGILAWANEIDSSIHTY